MLTLEGGVTGVVHLEATNRRDLGLRGLLTDADCLRRAVEILAAHIAQRRCDQQILRAERGQLRQYFALHQHAGHLVADRQG
ncbi:hypothetical protein D3C71_1755200 [compost metagenome]